ncbi:MAG: cell division protein ZapE [Paracoccaceae bacterium]
MGPIAEAWEARVRAGALRHDPAQHALLPRLDALAADLEAARPKSGLAGLFAKPPPAPRGLYLWGGVGRGKSMLMDLFHAAADVPRRRVHFHAFMQEVQAGIAAARKAGAEDAIRPVAERVAGEVRLLCFDEMQIGDIADAMIVGRLFEVLFERGVTVVATSNRPPDDLYKDGLNRALFLPFIAVLKERMEVVELESETDWRRHVLTGATVWFVPANRAAADEIDRVWTALTGGGGAGPLVLSVQGRAVTLPDARSGVARATFWDLCGRPLGPADYLAVAGAVRVLILEGIPLLSGENYNEAKRFVTLIDTLYEARVRLIASAADEPERLYIEGTGSFEFARTASRLREMQGAGWGK